VERDNNNNMHVNDTGDEKEPKSVRDANENTRKAQGDDATETPRSGNRPRFDRDR
jgi:hypothetical protein